MIESFMPTDDRSSAPALPPVCAARYDRATAGRLANAGMIVAVGFPQAACHFISGPVSDIGKPGRAPRAGP
jgi:hypothetical protein